MQRLAMDFAVDPTRFDFERHEAALLGPDEYLAEEIHPALQPAVLKPEAKPENTRLIKRRIASRNTADSVLENRVKSDAQSAAAMNYSPNVFSYYLSKYGVLLFYAGFNRDEADKRIMEIDKPGEGVKTLRMMLEGEYFAAAYKKSIFLDAITGGRKRFEASAFSANELDLTKNETEAFNFFVYMVNSQINRIGVCNEILPRMGDIYTNLCVLRHFYREFLKSI